MQRQIKENDIHCLLKYVPYEAVYQRIVDIYGTDNIFARRRILPGYFLWEWAGDGWQNLSNADPVMHRLISGEFDKERQNIVEKCPEDLKPLVEDIVTVPDDSCIYYRTDESGKIQIKIAAWGYIFQLIPPPPPPPPLQDISMKITYNGSPCANKNFQFLASDNKYYPITTDVNGVKNFAYTIGSTVRLKINGGEYHFIVEEGKKEYVIDTTLKTKVVVKVLMDSLPESGVQVVADNQKYLTDFDGKVNFETALPQNGEEFSVSVKDQIQSKGLKYGENYFRFEFQTPIPETEPEPQPEPHPECEPTPQPDHEPMPEPATVNEPEPNSEPQKDVVEGKAGGNGAKVFFGIIGLLMLVAATYFACYQILNQ